MRRWYVWVSVSVALFALLAWRTRPWEVFETEADWRLLLAAVALNIVVVAAWTIRSERLLAAIGHPLGLAALVPIVSFANTINNLTPASSGEALRAVILRRRHDVPLGRSTAIILVERLWAIWIMALSAGAAALGSLVPAHSLLVVGGWVTATAAIFAPAVAYRLGLRPAMAVANVIDAGPERSRRVRLAAFLTEIDTSLATLLASPGVASVFVASTAVVFTATAVQLWLILFALGHEVPLLATWAALGLGTIAGVLSALPFGLGAADVVVTGLLVGLGVPASAAAAAALLLRATVTLPLGLAGTASWVMLNRGRDATSTGAGAP